MSIKLKNPKEIKPGDIIYIRWAKQFCIVLKIKEHNLCYFVIELLWWNNQIMKLDFSGTLISVLQP